MTDRWPQFALTSVEQLGDLPGDLAGRIGDASASVHCASSVASSMTVPAFILSFLHLRKAFIFSVKTWVAR